MSNLNNQTYKRNKQTVQDLNEHCIRLDQKHALERKMKFLLDCRGYLIVNDIKGSYIEFGSFRSETQYCAFNILEKTQKVSAYVGLDTFTGEPEMSHAESELIPYVSKGSFASNYEEVREFVESSIGKKGKLIIGDFRDKSVMEKCERFTPISISMIDCNLTSSIASSIQFTMKNIVPGGLVFLDDFYTNFATGQPEVYNLLNSIAAQNGKVLVEHGTYHPFAKSFVVCDN